VLNRDVEYGGSGLGLFIARLLCRLQGGEIGVASQSGQGSTFAFYVKARRAETPHGRDVHTIVPEVNIPVGVPDPKSPSVRAQTQPAPQECSKFNILIVEDNVVNQKVLGKQLRNLGFAVDIANNGRECIDFLERSAWHKNHPHDGKRLSVILMDIEMPVMSGIEAVKYIRGMQEHGNIIAHVPIIAITANARAEQIAVAKEAGMDDVVSKPFRIPELLPKIESFVGPLERG
jgi:CheY-like chemotaxis protein